MRVVIVGSGFSGIKAALELSKRQVGSVTLIAEHSYFLHHATLYATATGKSTEESVIPLATIFAKHPNVTIIEDTITGLNTSKCIVSSGSKTYPYDKLVLALGSSTSFKNIKGLSRNAFGIASLNDVRTFQTHMQDAIISKQLEKEYFVIGAGAEGVELVAALSQYLGQLKAIHRIKGPASRVTLVEQKDRILPKLSKTASKLAGRRLKKLGVRVLLGQKVTELAGSTITVGSKLYPTETAIWTSGQSRAAFFNAHLDSFEIAPNGFVAVTENLEAQNNIYVLGDSNSLQNSAMARAALKQGAYAAKDIVRQATGRPRVPFKPQKPAVGITVGRGWSYVEWYGIYIAGRPGYYTRRLMELYGYAKLMPLSEALPIWRAHDLVDVDDAL